LDIYNNFTREELKANEQFVARVVFPLIYEEPQGTAIKGSGCFYRANNSNFVVTAAHVLEKLSLEDLGIPIAPVSDVRIRQFMNVEAHFPENRDIDVAVLELKDQLFIKEVFANWVCLSDENVDTSEDNEDDEYLVAGHPFRNVYPDGNKLIPKSLFQLYTSQYKGSVEKGKDETDLFMKHSKIAKNADNQIIETIDMEGVSGSPVWKLIPSTSGIWAPIRNLQLSAVECAFKANSYIRGKKWSVVEEIISKL